MVGGNVGGSLVGTTFGGDIGGGAIRRGILGGNVGVFVSDVVGCGLVDATVVGDVGGGTFNGWLGSSDDSGLRAAATTAFMRQQ